MCNAEVCKCSDAVCQLRLDFTTFTLTVSICSIPFLVHSIVYIFSYCAADYMILDENVMEGKVSDMKNSTYSLTLSSIASIWDTLYCTANISFSGTSFFDGHFEHIANDT